MQFCSLYGARGLIFRSFILDADTELYLWRGKNSKISRDIEQERFEEVKGKRLRPEWAYYSFERQR